MTELTQLYEDKDQLRDVLNDILTVMREMNMRLGILIEEERHSQRLVLAWQSQDEHYHKRSEKILKGRGK